MLPTSLTPSPPPWPEPSRPWSYNSLDPGGARTVGCRLHELGQVPGAINGVLGSPFLQRLFTVEEEQLQGHWGGLWEPVVRATSVPPSASAHPRFLPVCAAE